MITEAQALALMQDGRTYAEVRDQIRSGDLLVLHHSFVPNWYGVQIEAVQRFTGPFAHIAVIDEIAGRKVVYESVVPKVRCVKLSVAAEQGFFWLPMNRPMSEAEREQAWAEIGVNEYSKGAAMAAGLDILPSDEADQPRRWCAKFVGMLRALSDVYLGPRWVPSDQVQVAMTTYGAPLRYVSMR